MTPDKWFRTRPTVTRAWQIDLNAEQPKWVKVAFAEDEIEWNGDGESLWVLEDSLHLPCGYWLIETSTGFDGCSDENFRQRYEEM